MANNHASGTFSPYIPVSLITEDFKKLVEAVGATLQPLNYDNSMVCLYNEDYCTSGYIENEDGTEKEVSDDDLYVALQDIIRRSNGQIIWFSHEQAYTCDKMRSGEFGGSAIFITADDIQYHGTSSWLERRIAEAGNIPLHHAVAILVAGIHYHSTWDYHKHGEQQYFRKEGWRQDVANGDTILGYQDWVQQNLEHFDLEGVDAIEVAGCTETDGHVDVTTEGEEEAEFFSVYTHRPNEGVECICDFNTKDQAVAFANALASRDGLPVYGNCCNIEEAVQ